MWGNKHLGKLLGMWPVLSINLQNKKRQPFVSQDYSELELSSSYQRLPLIFHSVNFMSVLLEDTEQYGKQERRKEELKYLNQLSHGWNTKRISEDWNSNEKYPSSIAMGLLTTVVLIGIITWFLGTVLLQLIKLTLRGLFWPCNDYFFFHGKVGKVIWKEFGDPFLIFWCWRLWVETRTVGTDVSLGAEHERGGDKHWGPSLQENMDKITLITSCLVSICSPFIFLFCIPTPFCLTLNWFLFLSSVLLFQKK